MRTNHAVIDRFLKQRYFTGRYLIFVNLFPYSFALREVFYQVNIIKVIMVKGGRGGAGRGAGRSYGHSHGRSYGHGHSYGRSHGYGGSRYGYSRYGGSRYGHSRYGRCGYGYGYGCRYVGGRMYRSYGYGGTQDAVALYEQQMDGIHNVPLSPVFFNGALTLFGNDTRVTNLLNTVQSVAEYQNPDNLTVMMAQPIYQEMTMDQYFPNGVLPPNQSEI